MKMKNKLKPIPESKLPKGWKRYLGGETFRRNYPYHYIYRKENVYLGGIGEVYLQDESYRGGNVKITFTLSGLPINYDGKGYDQYYPPFKANQTALKFMRDENQGKFN